MKILVIPPSITKQINENQDPRLIDKVLKISKQFAKQSIIFCSSNTQPPDLNKHGIRLKLIKEEKFFQVLSEVNNLYQKLVLFVVLHNNDTKLISSYLNSKYKIKVCFLNIVENIDNLKYTKITNEDDTLSCHCKPGIYKYRCLDRTQPHSLRLKIYKLPWINVH